MLKIDGVTDLNQISLTGVRAIALIGLLIVEPRSLEEIRQAFIDMKIMEESHSDDILRIDMNTIKAMGCDISRSSAKTDYKYVLSRHPFSLPVSDEIIKTFRRVYDKLKDKADIATLIEYDSLFKKVAPYIFDYDQREAFLGISAIRYFDTELLQELLDCAENGEIVELAYVKPGTYGEKIKEILAQKVVFKNDKVYLYGYDVNKKDSVILSLKGIKRLISRKLSKKGFEPKTVNVRFFLKDFGMDTLENEETIVSTEENGYIIEGKYFNDFVATQRILSLGSNCVVISPVEFKNSIISKLKEMRKIYE